MTDTPTKTQVPRSKDKGEVKKTNRQMDGLTLTIALTSRYNAVGKKHFRCQKPVSAAGYTIFAYSTHADAVYLISSAAYGPESL